MDRLSIPEVVGAVEGGQQPHPAVDLLEVLQIVPGSQVHTAVTVHPVIRLRAHKTDHVLREGRLDLEDRAELLLELRKERGQVAGANMLAAQQPPQRDDGDLLGQGGLPEQPRGDVLSDGISDGPPDQVHPADVLDPLLGFLVELEDEPQDVAGVDETDDDDVSRVRDLVVEDGLADTGLDVLDGRANLGARVDSHPPCGPGQRPEIAVVVLQDLQVAQVVQCHVDDRLRMGSESLDPVLGVALIRLGRDPVEDRVERGIAGSGPVQEDQGLHVGVDASHERQLGEGRADDGTVQVPARNLAEVAALLVEECQDEFVDQAQRLGHHTACGTHRGLFLMFTPRMVVVLTPGSTR